MKNNFHRSLFSAAVFGALALPGLVFGDAEFQYTQYGDMLVGFRKPGVGSFELVVNIGNVTNFEGQAVGTTVPIGNYTPGQLSAAFSDGFGSLNWSVSSTFPGAFGSWSNYQVTTIWYTVPRTNVSTQTVAPSRASKSAQSGYRQNMLGVGSGAATISSSIGTSNANNTAFLVREPVWDGTSQIRNDLTFFVDNVPNGLPGTFGLPTVVENTTPGSFTSAIRSDLYRSRPTGFTDPDTGSTTGPAYYVGYFQLNSDGTMTFTRGSPSVAVPPPPQIVRITRSGGTSTVYFTTTNGATYSLYYTNSAGLTQPVTNWPSSPTTLTGDGLTNQLTDVTADANRFYRVRAQ